MFARLFGRGKGDAPSGGEFALQGKGPSLGDDWSALDLGRRDGLVPGAHGRAGTLNARPARGPWLAGSGPSGPGPRSDPHSALHKLDETIELTQKRVELLEKKQEQEQEKAKAYLAKGNKKAAMLCLQQKKMYEQEVERMQNVILNMMKQKQELEGMSHTQEVVSAQKLATDAQKRAVKSMKVEDVTKMQDEMEDIRADYEEVVQAIAGNAGLDVEDPDLQKELDELEGQVLEEKMLDTPAVPATQLPSAPRTVPQGRAPPAAQTDEEKELEELQREIGLAA